MSVRKILLMDRPSYWGAARQHFIKDLIPEIREITQEFQIEYLDGQANLDSNETTKRTLMTRDSIKDVEIAVSFDLGKEALLRADKLKWIHILSAGVDHALYPELIQHQSTMTSSKGGGGIPMAETAMMLMLMLIKNVPHYFKSQQQKQWKILQNLELGGMTAGIIGLGHSGSELARKCKAFDMRTLGFRRTNQPCVFIDEMFTKDNLHHFLSESDFLIITAPNTPETNSMIGLNDLRIMKPTSYIIVTSRGGVINDDALIQALDQGFIAGAGLDAHTMEPLPPESPFWTYPNVIVTPHMAAGGQLMEERTRKILLDNFERYVLGKSLLNIVDKKAGY
jgi:phosphoglycerate dehydrogenase-like enzyme